MPRPKKAGDDGKEVKKRSRNGCWPCKSRKVKCGEEKPVCANCQRQGEACDYSIRLNWDGRSKKKENGTNGFHTISFNSQPLPLPALSQSLQVNAPHNSDSALPALAPAPVLTTIEQMPILPGIDSRNSSGSSDQSLPPVSKLGHPVRPLPIPHVATPAPFLRNPTWDAPIGAGFNTARNNLRGSISYPSPIDSSFGSPSYTSTTFSMNGSSSYHMPPPMTSNPSLLPDAVPSPYNSAKRMRMSPRADNFSRQPALSRSLSSNYGHIDDVQRHCFNPGTSTYFPPHLRDPLTPATSSTSHLNDGDDRRISVSSLLSEDPDELPSRKNSPTSYPLAWNYEPMPEPPRRGSLHQRMISYSETETYGHDRGLPDWDLGRNNDTVALSGGNTPSEHSDFESWLNDADLGIPEFGFRLESKDQAFNPGGYYSSPVPIKIPRKLEPLPSTLTTNPMNLLYFHHFLNHTARILVIHDCPENPFKTILPKMAVESANLLNLMLTYSACHRARLLGHKEPVNRIAHWVRDVFPSLRQTLDETQNTEISNANLATAIMLASLEIISPSSFGIAIPWQAHLGLARGIIRARGGPHSISRKDPVMFFLSRWLAYLDVLGSLSSRNTEEPLYEANFWQSSYENTSAKELSLTDDDDGDDDDDYTIDCLLGFTTRCITILAQVASLARQVAPYRMRGHIGIVDESWTPSPDIIKKADRLKADLERARNHEQRQCHHHSPVLLKATLTYAPPPTHDLNAKEADEALATNDAFHWAGKVHLLRRVYNLPRSHPEVVEAVRQIMNKMYALRQLGSAEACSLFPIFTAGVETEDKLHRAEILSRLKGAEGLGMCQVNRARKIMEESWKTGANWETLVKGDFFG
ncbi:hypothetical protein LTR05_006583 [Lithohypha guttulata]|uniref:Zn(2)-C6 fungal-type domain-containing protein n=2 Tax=Lithohypha guttulata TaxID=1690604 RepID=A0AAN7YEG1_9EURO|nr:hypothetical protein LTR05_006583 [Lithohypha guttulata]